ncbi:ABC transporter ATP-binding protein [Lacisediminimonas profundi]|uniref:ABC transporter ATP-binding protein n=1 Tax=Lacisediminimonas profundi TaxID=2603856 RepID=UPI00124B341A|nr:ABC transporter ATP-binding protein [Lacisediminimonas profundi]
MSMLSIQALHASYDGAPVLHGISLDVEQGSFVAVIGANTAGKSTLLRTISGLVPRRSGKILFNGRDLLQMPAHEIPVLGIAHVPEGRQVFPLMTVEENLMLGAYVRRQDKQGVADTLEQVYQQFPRLAERRKQLAGTLSGGEQQMAAIGRALMGKPSLLLLDEPSHGLAPKIVQELHDALIRIHSSGVTMMLIEQNTQLALSVAKQAFVMQSGRIVLEGSSDGMLNDPRIREAFLGI